MSDDRFFSHRRDRGSTGRHLAIAWRQEARDGSRSRRLRRRSVVGQYIPKAEVVRERFAEVSGRVAEAAAVAGRDPAEVRILVATKYVAGEESKSGIAPAAADAFLEEAAACGKVCFCGLMCMPPLCEDAAAARPYFAQTRELAARLSTKWQGTYTFDQLSMGTSDDYEAAVQEGATIVRVGSVLF